MNRLALTIIKTCTTRIRASLGKISSSTRLACKEFKKKTKLPTSAGPCTTCVLRAVDKILDNGSFGVVRDEFGETSRKLPTSAEQSVTYGPNIHAYHHKIIGCGCTSVVYKGFNESANVPAAVKVMPKANVSYFRNELERFRQLPANRNILRYYGMWETDHEYIIATELCDTDLERLINTSGAPLTEHQKIKIIKDICRGLQHMHSYQIAHGAIKPSNILLKMNSDGSYTAKLSDFGTTRSAGTYDLVSPASLQAIYSGNITYRASLKDDICSLGELINYIWLSNRQPSYRASNVWQKKSTMGYAAVEHFELENLLHAMIHNDPNQRPSINQVIEHPFFWTDKHRLYFVITLHSLLKKNGDKYSKFRACLESRFSILHNASGGWDEVLDNEWYFCIENQTKKKQNVKRYNYRSLASLIAFIRNKFAHREELAVDPKLMSLLRSAGDADDLIDASSYMRYFREKFPKLILVACTTEGIERFKFKSEFQLPSREIFQLGPANETVRSIRRN